MKKWAKTGFQKWASDDGDNKVFAGKKGAARTQATGKSGGQGREPKTGGKDVQETMVTGNLGTVVVDDSFIG